MNIYDTLVSFETAKLAKEKGCDIHSVLYFSTKGIPSSTEIYYTDKWIDKNGTLDYYRHTQSLLQKWLREIHGIYIMVDVAPLSGLIDFYFHIRYGENLVRFKKGDDPLTHDTYEEALEKGLQEGLKLLKDKK